MTNATGRKNVLSPDGKGDLRRELSERAFMGENTELLAEEYGVDPTRVRKLRREVEAITEEDVAEAHREFHFRRRMWEMLRD